MQILRLPPSSCAAISLTIHTNLNQLPVMAVDELRLLALDGGGVRGLSALMILEQLMEAVNPDAPPKPCEYFDMIGGTSTGGLIAIMLGRLRMSVADSIAAYLTLSDRVFRKTRHRVTVRGKVQGRFDSEELARAVREVVQQQGLSEDTLLKDAPEAGCRVFVCATSKETSETVCLTSYRTPRGNSDLLNSVKMWEACRATSAASSFFDPIAVGRFDEKFVDGATGANNPVRELWDQAQLVWGPGPLEGKVKCLVSIGTGVPSLKPFKDDVFHIAETLIAIATETEQTAERFRREKSLLADTGRYYRFNVVRGLEDIGLEESKKVKEMAAATRKYIGSEEVYRQMQACAGSIAGRAYFGEYHINFSLEGVPTVSHFVDRPKEMEGLERVLLPGRGQSCRQKIHVLHGLGGIGKTQLAVAFARQYHRQFSSVFWLDGSSEDNLKRSIVSHASRIPSGQIPETSRKANSEADVNAVVKGIMDWLARPDNTVWLLIFDNVDREYDPRGSDDPDAYNVKDYLSGADHGSVLVTTRLAKLQQLGESQPLTKVDHKQAQAILESWYKGKHDTTEIKCLLEKLDGLPLAIAQAGAYLQQSGVGLTAYLRFYEQQWSELMESDDAPLQDYPRSVWKTWAISYQTIRREHEATANLLLLWSFLDNKDLWYGLIAAADQKSTVASRMLSEWIGGIASSELEFSRAMKLLLKYSLIEKVEETASYATHPVVHQWAYHSQGKCFAVEITRLAVITVGYAVPMGPSREDMAIQRRLHPHAQVCSKWVVEGKTKRRFADNDGHAEDVEKDEELSVLQAAHNLGILYKDQGKLGEAEQMYKWVLRECEQLAPDHTLILVTTTNLGNVYSIQGKVDKAEQMYMRALQGYEEALRPKHYSILETVNNLGVLYMRQGKLDKAEQMYKRALQGNREPGSEHTSMPATINNLGNVYMEQGKLDKAEQMYIQALQGCEEALGPKQYSTLETVNNLGVLYKRQGKLDKAEQMYKRALQGYQRVLDHTTLQTYQPALDALNNMAVLYKIRGENERARAMYSSVLVGYQVLFGPSHDNCQELEACLDRLPHSQQGKEDGWAVLAELLTSKAHGSTEDWSEQIAESVTPEVQNSEEDELEQVAEPVIPEVYSSEEDDLEQIAEPVVPEVRGSKEKKKWRLAVRRAVERVFQ
ncbi:uncharacterized protein K460DRAFT_382125 [Cucurbitaria berberidis CBS 394.84]|uniref:PNPLA domain-containing protein n=1 Tax=Cucurbitaria berberidis CBS 394.84 TaxID=1168544 RepID=A0A9P4GSS4_9PLEO|nr:uncharacterized protein K460DRAFT_382125 [Cucurbitaria berberidis CBS 394.84]KAF1850391.1 hypothetical protein K460DRAFT_382125 [Cucurbitaria berberidis CBS 394.84]